MNSCYCFLLLQENVPRTKHVKRIINYFVVFSHNHGFHMSCTCGSKKHFMIHWYVLMSIAYQKDIVIRFIVNRKYFALVSTRILNKIKYKLLPSDLSNVLTWYFYYTFLIVVYCHTLQQKCFFSHIFYISAPHNVIVIFYVLIAHQWLQSFGSNGRMVAHQWFWKLTRKICLLTICVIPWDMHL
jgi:hypothetical protein